MRQLQAMPGLNVSPEVLRALSSNERNRRDSNADLMFGCGQLFCILFSGAPKRDMLPPQGTRKSNTYGLTSMINESTFCVTQPEPLRMSPTHDRTDSSTVSEQVSFNRKLTN